MTSSSPTESATVRSHRSLWLALLVLVVGIALGAAVTAVIVTRADDQPSKGSSTAGLAQVQASCRDWMSSAQGDQADASWCRDMFAWMDDQSNGSMMHSMMWQGPQQMSTSCREWVDQEPGASGTSRLAQCKDMVDWMDQHMSSRGGSWMMQGS